MKTKIKVLCLLTVIFFLVPLFFTNESAFAQRRNCYGNYKIYPQSVSGGVFTSLEFYARGDEWEALPGFYPSRSRMNASCKLQMCMEDHWNRTKENRSYRCNESKDVYNYPFNNLEKELGELICRQYNVQDSYIIATVKAYTHGDRGCGECEGAGTRPSSTYKSSREWTLAENHRFDCSPVVARDFRQFSIPDTEKPTVKIDNPKTYPLYLNPKNSNTYTLKGTASDNIGVTKVTWTAGGDLAMPGKDRRGDCSGTTKWTCSNIPLLKGKTTIRVIASDAAGNNALDRITIIRGTSAATSSPPDDTTPSPPDDTIPPTVAITSPTSDPTSPLTLRGTASDTGGIVRVTWANNRGGSGLCSGTENWSCSGITLKGGRNNITITAEDAAGNNGTDCIEVRHSGGPH
jgi:hypothetical protein